ncbi:uncharacterized protein si:dkey-30e9.6 [Scomber scombrus]|uniref:uncharacterized protein si:dkey-30e9.6 n=1 Tax=Scomber scombrus TaxID=13677 RepID=UPI002DDB76FD|nr:uncharacterized protein si:dkey-30e9.6 [Scomber scombrus]
MVPYGLLHPLSSVCFEDKIQFSASQDVYFARSKWFTLPEAESRGDVWSIKPPDFSLKLYRSLSIPQKKERKPCVNPAVSQPSETKRRIGIFLPNILHENHKRKDSPKFITSYRPPDALASELMFVKKGKYPSGHFKNHKLHNFRPLDEDLPDIVTAYERDPVRTTRSESDLSLRDTKTKMNTFKPAEPRWDERLMLPHQPWPPKSASYTRHRRRRGTYSAFLDRVEEKLSNSWKNRS